MSQSLGVGRDHRGHDRGGWRDRRAARRPRRVRASADARQERLPRRRGGPAASRPRCRRPGRWHLALTTIRTAISRSALGVDVDVAVALVVLDDRHLGLGDDAADQALAAARDDQVDARSGIRGGGRRPRGRWSGRAARRRRAGRGAASSSARTRCMARLEWMASLPPRRMTALPLLTQSAAASSGHVGPALVDDEDDAERHADLRHLQAVGPPARR